MGLMLITTTRAGTWPVLMTTVAERLRSLDLRVAISPDPSTGPGQRLVLVQWPDGQTSMAVIEPAHGADPDRVFDDLLVRLTPTHQTAVEMLGERYKYLWQGHHRAAAALTLWWDARMVEGYTVESARVMLELAAHREVLSRVMLDEFDGRMRAWLGYRPVTDTADPDHTGDMDLQDVFEGNR